MSLTQPCLQLTKKPFRTTLRRRDLSGKDLFSECVVKGSCFCLRGLEAGRVRSDFGIARERPRTTANDRKRPRATVLCPMRCTLRISLEGGRLGEALWRCAVVIAGESLVWVGPCRLIAGQRSGWRCAVVIAGESLVWVALCRCDCWGEPGLGGAVSL